MKQAIWIERLSIIDVFFIFCRSSKLIYYDEHQTSHLLRVIIKLLRNCGILKNVTPAALSFNKKTSDGKALIYSAFKDLNDLINEILKNNLLFDSNQAKAMLKTYLSGYILPSITFIKMVETKIESTNSQYNTIYLKRSPFTDYLVRFYANSVFSIKASYSFGEMIKYYVRPCYFLVMLIAGICTLGKARSNISQIKPSVWVEYTHKDVVDFLFWRNYAKSEDFDIVYYLDRADTPPSTEVVNEIQRKNVYWIDAHIIPLVRSSGHGWRFIKQLLAELVPSEMNYPYWYMIFRFEHLFWYTLYRSTFSQYKVKIIIQHKDTSWKQEIIAQSIESTGGILIGFNWSNYPTVMSPSHLFPFHTLFYWGEIIADFIKHGEHTCRYMLPSGVWLTSDNNERLSVFFPDDIKFIIAIFDSSVLYNISQSPESLSEFYQMLLKLIEQNRQWGGIVKSKNWEVNGFNSLPHGQEITARMRELIAKKRLVVLSPLVSPVAASTASNLSVCFGLNSAGIISGVYGNRVVHWDCTGWIEHPIYLDPDQNFLFRTLDELKEAVLMAGNGNASIGDFSKWRQKFNYFDDVRAPERVGSFIKDFIERTIEVNGNAEGALKYAVAKYTDKNSLMADNYGQAKYTMDQKGRS